MRRLVRRQALQFGQQFPLRVGKIARSNEAQSDQQIATRAYGAVQHAVAGNAQLHSIDQVARQRHRNRSVKRGNFDKSACQCAKYTDRHFATKMGEVRLEKRMRRDFNVDNQVARTPAAPSASAMTLDAQAAAGWDARRNIEEEPAFLPRNPAGTLASRAL